MAATVGRSAIGALDGEFGLGGRDVAVGLARFPRRRCGAFALDPAEPRALSREQLRALQRETDRLRSSRDRAIVQLLMLTGMRIGELAELEVDDVRLTQRTGELVIRHGSASSTVT